MHWYRQRWWTGLLYHRLSHVAINQTRK